MGDKNERKTEIIFNPEPVVYSDYADAPKIPAVHVKSCTRMIENAAPEDLDESERKQLGAIGRAAHRVEVIVTDRQAVGAVRPWLASAVNTWCGVSDALLGTARIPAAVSDRGERATKLLAVLFPEGISWVSTDAFAMWGESDRILRVIQDRKLARELDALAGEGSTAALVKCTADLGEAIGVGKTPRELPESKGLQEARTQWAREVARYARMLSAKVDENDPRSVDRFRRAIAKPIDQFRSRRGGSSPDADVVDPDAPTDPAGPALPSPFEPTPSS